MSDRQGVEIDYCPKCRGVWLDRGELDKIIDRVAETTPAVGRPEPDLTRPLLTRPDDRAYRSYDDDDDDDRYPGTRPRQHRKKKSFLSEVFDFD